MRIQGLIFKTNFVFITKKGKLGFTFYMVLIPQ